MKRNYKFIDLFSGAGGFSRGFEEAGFRSILAVENHPAVSKTYKENFPKAIVLSEDIKRINIDVISKYIEQPENIDVIIASPPCEPFTGANPKRQKHPIDRLYRDPAGQLFLHAIRIIGEVQPRIFFIENVKGVLVNEIRNAIRKELSRYGYRNIYFNILKAEDHGVPSKRTRVFISNIRLNLEKEPQVTVEEALERLPPPGSPYPFNHEYTTLSPSKMRKLECLKWGKSLIKYMGAGGKKLPNLIRLDPRYPAPTVLGSSQFIHPYENRLLTVREQARLMGFPDYHVFLGSKDIQYNQVGEAVPPPLAYRISRRTIEFLENHTPNPLNSPRQR
ncbi:MAG: DNA cytosine methyltransferase [Desulfurococcales archaeon]|nr:DNA cytosine methyltransferase [Desulfurococcales archaeon]